MNKKNIAIFVVTYNAEEHLKKNLESLLESKKHIKESVSISINVINNYTVSFSLNNFLDKNNIKLFNNYLRPSFSTGHLSRNWNQGIILGFENLISPVNDIVCLVQDDSIFKKNWINYIIEKHKTLDFITFGGGDQFHSYNVEHIKKVGLWDERFSNIGYQEADYFIRSFIHNKNNISINDEMHFRVFNPLENRVIEDDDDLIGYYRNDERHLESLKHHKTSLTVLHHKWGKKTNWDTVISSKIKDKNVYYILYPYFEKDIYLNNQTLPKKRTVTLWDFLMFLIEKNSLILRIFKELEYQLKKRRK